MTFNGALLSRKVRPSTRTLSNPSTASAVPYSLGRCQAHESPNGARAVHQPRNAADQEYTRLHRYQRPGGEDVPRTRYSYSSEVYLERRTRTRDSVEFLVSPKSGSQGRKYRLKSLPDPPPRRARSPTVPCGSQKKSGCGDHGQRLTLCPQRRANKRRSGGPHRPRRLLCQARGMGECFENRRL